MQTLGCDQYCEGAVTNQSEALMVAGRRDALFVVSL